MSRAARIFVAELIGTMILILGGPGTVIFGQFLGFDIGVLGVSLAFGLSLLCAAYLFGHISGLSHQPGGHPRHVGAQAHRGRECPSTSSARSSAPRSGGFVIWAILATGDNAGQGKLVRAALFSGASNGFADHSPSRLRVLGRRDHRGRVHRAVHPRDRGHHPLVGDRRVRRHPDRADAGADPHDHDPDRQHVGEPCAELLHRALRGFDDWGR